MSEAPPRRVCIVCGRVLDYVQGEGYRHILGSVDPSETDHPAIPVAAEEAGDQIRPRCDFCFADDPEWTLPARTFGEPPQMFVGDWSACEVCAHLIEKDAWNRLLDRFVAGWEARHEKSMRPEIRSGVQRLWRALRKNVTGSIYREEKP